VQVNDFASKAATSAVIVGHSSNYSEFLLTVHSERHFRIIANWLTFSIFSSQQWQRGPDKWISLGPRIS